MYSSAHTCLHTHTYKRKRHSQMVHMWSNTTSLLVIERELQKGMVHGGVMFLS